MDHRLLPRTASSIRIVFGCSKPVHGAGATGRIRLRLAVISDIHSDADAFAAALDGARDQGFDQLLILGDLLTYGMQPVRTLELVAEAESCDRAVLIRGNHDQMYLDGANGRSDYADSLPEWIRESVDWTSRQLARSRASLDLGWVDSWCSGGVYAAHANPFGRRDWTYLRTAEMLERARQVIAAACLRLGIFGHTHRFRHVEDEGVNVVTVGSIGQPRSEAPVSEWTQIDMTRAACTVTRHPVAVDWHARARAVRASTLSPATQDRLCSFFAQEHTT